MPRSHRSRCTARSVLGQRAADIKPAIDRMRSRLAVAWVGAVALLCVALVVTAGAPPQATREVVLAVLPDSTCRLQGKTLAPTALKGELASRGSAGAPIDLRIRVTGPSGYQRAGEVVVLAQDIGIQGIGFIEDPPASAGRPASPALT